LVLGRATLDGFHIKGLTWPFDWTSRSRSWTLFNAWRLIEVLVLRCGALGCLVPVFVLKRLRFVVRLLLPKWLRLAIRRGLVVSLGFAVGLSIGVLSLLHRCFIEVATLTRVVTAAIFELDVLELPFRFEAL
jgi:hypothetical protein